MMKTMSKAETEAAKAAAERNRALLAERQEELKAVGAFLEDLERQRRAGRRSVRALVPLFGGAALLPAELVLDGRALAPEAADGAEEYVLTWLGTDLFARTDVRTAQALLRARTDDVAAALDDLARGVAALTLDGPSAPGAPGTVHEADGVMDICEPITEHEAEAQRPRPATAEELAALEERAAQAACQSKSKSKSKDEGGEGKEVDAFFAAMAAEEARWAALCEAQEAAGEDVDEAGGAERARAAAARLWPRGVPVPADLAPKDPAVGASPEGKEAKEEEEVRVDVRAAGADAHTLRPAVDAAALEERVVEHEDGAAMAAEGDSDSDGDYGGSGGALGTFTVAERVPPGLDDDEDEDDDDEDDEEKMVIRPRNPTSFVPRAKVHTPVPRGPLGSQKPGHAHGGCAACSGCGDDDDDDDYESEDEDEDLVCFAHADGHRALPPKVHSKPRQ